MYQWGRGLIYMRKILEGFREYLREMREISDKEASQETANDAEEENVYP